MCVCHIRAVQIYFMIIFEGLTEAEAVYIVTDGVCVCLQLGGTVGDIESMPFIEAFRQFQFKVKRENFCNIHVSLIPQVRGRNPSRRLRLQPRASIRRRCWNLHFETFLQTEKKVRFVKGNEAGTKASVRRLRQRPV